MGWAIGFDSNWNRDIGYGVPATCDHPGCNAEIDRGLAHVCGGGPYATEFGCGLYFCSEHLQSRYFEEYDEHHQVCERCMDEDKDPFEPKPDTPEWINHKLTDPSWEPWRKENPEIVKEMRSKLHSKTRDIAGHSGT